MMVVESTSEKGNHYTPVEPVANLEWVDGVADAVQATLSAVVAAGGAPARKLKSWLNGTWLGHPLHPALTDVPIGAWGLSLIFDVLRQRMAAETAIWVGVASAVPTAAAGLADWHDTEAKPRRVGVMHALLNSTALGLFVGSLAARRSGANGLGISLSALGFSLVTYSAYLGGELVYMQGTGVKRTAWEPEPEQYDRYRVIMKESELPEGRLTAGEVEVNGQKVAVVLLRRGSEVLALSNTCSHWGGPLAEGQLRENDCVECPWHGSTFNMRDGSVVEGPSAFPQPVFEVRLRAGNVEVRRAS